MKLLITSIVLMLPLVNSAQELRRVVDLRGQWKFSIGDNPRWSRPEYDDHSWENIFVPSPWENEGFGGFDGYAWYRITVDLKNISEHNLYLVLGYIDDVDRAYINGQLIGFSGSFPPDFYTAFKSYRQYPIPDGVLNKDGKNVIAIRVFDTILEGGIIKGDIGIFTNKNQPDKTQLLEGAWKLKEGDSYSWKYQDYNDSHWDDIMVPSFWKSLKKSRIESIGWYRKEFHLADYLKNEEDLVLIVGLIDDFDETFINGVMVGSTNDGQWLGHSQSYRELRVYDIPKGVLKKDGNNLLAVRVKDLGVDAGIYRGPIAIVPRANYQQLLNSWR